jgi:hypothetical protein
MRIGVKATRSGDTLTVLVRDGGNSHASAFTIFPVDLVATKVLSASRGLTCIRRIVGRGTIVACRGGPHAGKTVRVSIQVVGRKSRFVNVEVTGRGQSTSVDVPVTRVAPGA